MLLMITITNLSTEVRSLWLLQGGIDQSGFCGSVQCMPAVFGGRGNMQCGNWQLGAA
jgi:hypothetical protein